MMVKRGEIWLANLNPVQGSEQAGTLPVLIFQNDQISRYTSTVLVIPLTTNLRQTRRDCNADSVLSISPL
jgi:mRNA interferase MazF